MRGDGEGNVKNGEAKGGRRAEVESARRNGERTQQRSPLHRLRHTPARTVAALGVALDDNVEGAGAQLVAVRLDGGHELGLLNGARAVAVDVLERRLPGGRVRKGGEKREEGEGEGEKER